jgi:hypothetical protein
MSFSAASALRKISHYHADEDLRLKRGYYETTHFDHLGVGSSCTLEYPAAVCPPSAKNFHYSMCAGALLSCLVSRQRHQEKWWIGGLFLSIGYFVSAKFDESGSGIQAHNAGVIMSGVGTLGLLCRTIANSGRRSFNVKCMGLLIATGWYEWGMSHIWTAYIAHFKQEATGRSSAFTTSLWIEYVPQHIDPTFVHYHKLQTLESHTSSAVRDTGAAGDNRPRQEPVSIADTTSSAVGKTPSSRWWKIW